MYLIKNKVALVTGGGQGLGRGISIELANAGTCVVVADLNLENAKAVANEIEMTGQKAFAFQVDVTDLESIKSCVRESLRSVSRIDILVNNAGVMQRKSGTDTTSDDFEFCYEVNVKGLWNITNEIIPIFKKNRGGKIVNISSVGGRKGWAETPAYGASKAAVINLTQSLALALGPYNINVNAVCPGLIRTSMMGNVRKLFAKSDEVEEAVSEETYSARAAERVPLRRLSTPEDIGHAAVFFASDYSKNVTGQALNVDGGLLMN